MRKISSVVIGAALLLASSICAAAPVSASAGGHCSYRLDPIGRNSRGIVRARLVQAGCFATFAEALLIGSGGAIHLPSGSTPASLTEGRLASFSSERGSVLIGTEYNQTGFGGTSNNYFASSTCTASTTWEVANVTISWNDLFESGKGFGGCDTNKKFRDTGFGGTVVTCTPNCSDYGALDNQVSSLRWRI